MRNTIVWWLTILLGAMTGRAGAAEVVWTGAGGDLSWSNRSNWSGSVVPGLADDVVIPELPGEVMIEVTSNVHVRSIVCEEGIAYRSRWLAVDEMSRIAVLGEGYMLSVGEAGLTVTEGGVLPEIVHSTTPGTTGRTLVIGPGANVEMRSTRGIYTRIRNEGVLRWTGTTVSSSSNYSEFDNYGVWELAGSGIEWVGSAPIRNYGTMRRVGTGVVRIYNRAIAFELVSPGHIEVESGTLALDTVGVISGNCQIAEGATLHAVPFYATPQRRLRFVGDMTITGGGQLEVGWAIFEGGLALEGHFRSVGQTTIVGDAVLTSIEHLSNLELAFMGALWGGELTCDGGSVRFEGTTSLGRAALSRCTVYGAGDITVREELSRFGRFFIGFWWTGSLTLAEGSRGVLNFNSGTHDLTVAGDLSISSGLLRLRELAVAPSGVLRVALGSSGGVSAQAAALDGRCQVELSPGFDPVLHRLFSFTILYSSQISGDFASLVLPPAPPVGAYEFKRTATTIEVVHDVFDYNADGGVDADDVIEFFRRWRVGDRYADVNADGATDSADVVFFMSGWDAGGL